MQKQSAQAQAKNRNRKRVRVLEVASMLNCHPATVPRLVLQKRLPPPDKLLNKNTWFEDEIDDAIARGLSPQQQTIPRHAA